MPIIVVECECGRKLRAGAQMAGKWVRCPSCGNGVQIPLPVGADEPMVMLEDETPPPAPSALPSVPPSPLEFPKNYHRPNPSAPQHAVPAIAAPEQTTADAERSWRGYVYWLLLLALIPLGVLTFVKPEETLERISRTLENHPDVEEHIGVVENLSDHDVDRMFDLLPAHRLDGALLPRQSWAHWAMAFCSAGVFFLLVSFAIPGFPAKPVHLLWAGLFTGTGGVILLYGIQIFGFFCFCCIGAAYIAALDPNAPFGASLIGFFFGVGFFEELIKSLPVLWLLYRNENIGWRTACLWGMASGAGFGVSEGISYASNYYNGLEPATIYFVRFLSCVAFHTMLSGACAMLLQRKLKYLHEGEGLYDWCLTFMAIVTVPILLHGLFNALAKKELDILALLVALASFAWLAHLIKQSRERENALLTVTASAPRFVRTEQGTRYVGPDRG